MRRRRGGALDWPIVAGLGIGFLIAVGFLALMVAWHPEDSVAAKPAVQALFQDSDGRPTATVQSCTKFERIDSKTDVFRCRISVAGCERRFRFGVKQNGYGAWPWVVPHGVIDNPCRYASD